jgi:hypothetical protein
MADRRQQGREFWYDFDNQTLWRRTPEMDAAITAAYGAFGGSLDSLAQLFALSFRQPNHPTPFTTAIQAGKQGFLDLAEAQHKIMTKHFGSDAGALRDALIDFGQGVLFDNRPPRQVTHFVHMMDGTPADFVGYHRWHASIRAAMFFGADAAFYEALCHNIALAWAIQTEANPTIDGQSNPGLPADRLQVLSDFWGNLDLATIDRAFVTFKPAAPKPGDLQPVLTSLAEAAVGTSFQDVQDILNKAAGDGAPLHQDNGRFWNLALSDFRKLTVYGVQVIADKGPDRGANSGLIQALKGEPPFGPDGSFPRMPLNRPPVSPDNIALIQKWIDDGGPDQVKPTGPAPA